MGIAIQARQLELGFQHLYKDGMLEPTPLSYPLTSMCVPHVCPLSHTHTQIHHAHTHDRHNNNI